MTFTSVTGLASACHVAGKTSVYSQRPLQILPPDCTSNSLFMIQIPGLTPQQELCRCLAVYSWAVWTKLQKVYVYFVLGFWGNKEDSLCFSIQQCCSWLRTVTKLGMVRGSLSSSWPSVFIRRKTVMGQLTPFQSLIGWDIGLHSWFTQQLTHWVRCEWDVEPL